MKKIKNTVLIMLLVALMCNCRKVKINAEKDLVKVKGKITNFYSGVPIKNASISIYNLELNGTYDELVGTCKSNDSGRFEATMDRVKLKANYFEFFVTAYGYSGNVCGSNSIWANRTVLDTINLITKNLVMCY